MFTILLKGNYTGIFKMKNKKEKQDTGFGVSIDVIKFQGNTVTRIVNDWANREMAL